MQSRENQSYQNNVYEFPKPASNSTSDVRHRDNSVPKFIVATAVLVTSLLALVIAVTVMHFQQERELQEVVKLQKATNLELSNALKDAKQSIIDRQNRTEQQLRRHLELHNISVENIEERPNKSDPSLHFYIPSLTWETGKSYCRQFEKTLCSIKQICPSKGNVRQPIFDVIPGNHWVPILDKYNEWIEIGDYHRFPCINHAELAAGALPTWGTTSDHHAHKGYVYCCQDETTKRSPNVRYQFIGKSATYNRSLDHCEAQGKRLCYSTEACNSNKPVLGLVKENKWIAVKDRFNEWIQIGSDSGNTCKTQGVLSGSPSWGIREDNSQLEYVGYVYCCNKAVEDA